MVTYYGIQNDFQVDLQADSVSSLECAVFSLSRTMAKITRTDDQKLTIVNIQATMTNETKTLGNFYTDPEGVLELPLRNLVNYAIDQGETQITVNFSLRETNSLSYFDYIAVAFDLYNGISYGQMLAPKKKEADAFTLAMYHNAILPPNIMFNPYINNVGQGVWAESNYHSIDKNSIWSEYTNGIGTTITPSGARSNQLQISAYAETLNLTDGVNSKTWELTNVDSCTNFAAVRWTSLTGCARQHYFPIVSFINGNDKEVSIVSAGNGYDVRKNPVKGVRCRICGLTAYGCWYYQDLLQASDAHAIIQQTWIGFNNEMASSETAVFVEGGMESTPEGNGFYNFEFTLKLRHYDTV